MCPVLVKLVGWTLAKSSEPPGFIGVLSNPGTVKSCHKFLWNFRNPPHPQTTGVSWDILRLWEPPVAQVNLLHCDTKDSESANLKSSLWMPHCCILAWEDLTSGSQNCGVSTSAKPSGFEGPGTFSGFPHQDSQTMKAATVYNSWEMGGG